MSYYNVCEFCGSYLDPGESCDCVERKKIQEESLLEIITSEKNGQMIMREVISDDFGV